MPILTEAEVQSQVQAAVRLFRAIYKFGSLAGTSSLTNPLDDLAEEYKAVAIGDYGHLMQQAVADVVNAQSGMIAAARRLMEPVLLHYMQVTEVNEPDTDVDAMFERLRENFEDRGVTVERRGITFGSVAAGAGNTGSGTILRQVLDRFGQPLEQATPEKKVFDCVESARSGAFASEERFNLRGGARARTFTEFRGSGTNTSIRAVSARLASQFLGNPSFDRVDASGVLTDWTPTGSQTTKITSPIFRTFPGATTPYSVRFDGVASLTQVLETTVRARFRRDTPYLARVMVNRNSSGADGDLILGVGGLSTLVDVTTLPVTGWYELSVPGPTERAANEAGWWIDDAEINDLALTISWINRTAGSLILDDALVVPFTEVDRTWWMALGGATNFILDDSFSAEDSEPDPDVGLIQQMCNLVFGQHLPSALSGPSFTDPTDA